MKFTLNRCAIALAASAALAASGAQARIVVDDNGTEVDIPERVNRVVVTNILPLASAVTVFLNDGKTVVGHASRLLFGRSKRTSRQALP